jgi:hypothetical protein
MFDLLIPRVPEPNELFAWVMRIPGRVWGYLSAPERRPLWLVVLVCTVLWFGQLDLIPLGSQETRYLTAKVAVGTHDPAAGTAGWFSRVLAILMGPQRDPRYAAALLAGAGILSLIVLYEAVWRYCSWRVAVLCCALVSAAPWAAVLTRAIRPSGLVLALSSLVLAGLLAALSGRRAWGWVLAWMSAVLLAILSPDGFPALCSVAVITAVWHRQVRWSHALLGVLLGLLLTLSAQYDSPQNTLPGQASAFWAMTPPSEDARRAALPALAGLLGGSGLERLISVTSTPLARRLETASTWWGWVCALSLVLAAGLGLRAWAHWREGNAPNKCALPAVWAATTVAIYLLRGTPVSTAAMLSLLAPTMLAVALTTDHLLNMLVRSESGSEWALGVISIAIIILGGYRCLELYSQVDRGNARTAYGTPLKQWRLVTTLATRASYDATEPLWVIRSGTAQRQADQATVLDYMLEGQHPVYLNGGEEPAILLPAERGVRYLLLGETPLQTGTLEHWQGDLAGLVTSENPADAAGLYRIASQPASQLLATIQKREWVAWDAGLRLVGYDLPALALYDRTLVFATYWTFEGVPESDRVAEHTLTITVVDARGQKYTSLATFGLAERQWRPGLLLKQWHVVHLPYVPTSEPVEIQLAIDRTSDGFRNLVVDDLGLPSSDHYVLGPFVFAE